MLADGGFIEPNLPYIREGFASWLSTKIDETDPDEDAKSVMAQPKREEAMSSRNAWNRRYFDEFVDCYKGSRESCLRCFGIAYVEKGIAESAVEEAFKLCILTPLRNALLDRSFERGSRGAGVNPSLLTALLCVSSVFRELLNVRFLSAQHNEQHV